jgi:hypothetical protein
MRPEEILGLELSELHLDAQRLDIARARETRGAPVPKPLKSEKSRRSLPLTRRTCEILTRHVERRRFAQRQAGDRWVSRHPRRGVPRRRSAIAFGRGARTGVSTDPVPTRRPSARSRRPTPRPDRERVTPACVSTASPWAAGTPVVRPGDRCTQYLRQALVLSPDRPSRASHPVTARRFRSRGGPPGRHGRARSRFVVGRGGTRMRKEMWCLPVDDETFLTARPEDWTPPPASRPRGGVGAAAPDVRTGRPSRRRGSTRNRCSATAGRRSCDDRSAGFRSQNPIRRRRSGAGRRAADRTPGSVPGRCCRRNQRGDPG